MNLFLKKPRKCRNTPDDVSHQTKEVKFNALEIDFTENVMDATAKESVDQNMTKLMLLYH